MKRLLLDIETAPHKVYTWGLFNQNIAINQIVEPGYTLCWAAKWVGERKVMFNSIQQSSWEEMILEIHELLNEADAVIHFNGKRFDMPTLNESFLRMGLEPPEPYKQIDLLQIYRSTFRGASNKLDYILQRLEIGSKIEHKGMPLWTACMDGDETAWRLMKRYNIGDVVPMEELYTKLLPWIRNHPNFALYTDTERPTCTNCGSDKVIKKGFEKTKTQIYQRYRCTDCGTPLKGRKTLVPADKRANILTQAA